MKNYFSILLATITFAVFTLSSCDKENKTEASSTMTQCKVNGVLWQSDLISTRAFLIDQSSLYLQGIKSEGSDSSFVIITANLTPNKIGIYEGNAKVVTGNYALFFPSININTQKDIMFNYTSTYKLEITKLDMTNHKISGTFSSIQNAPAGQSLPNYVVTEGKFTDIYLAN